MTMRRMVAIALLAVIGLSVAALATVGVVVALDPVGTGFSYQGRLMDGETPAQGEYDFRFALHDVEVGNSQQLLPFIEQDNVFVSEGLFTVHLDFGDVFDGEARWLEVAVRPGDSLGAYTTLSPRQPLAAVPYATFASGGPFWALGGNSGTTAGANFLGTTDNQPLVIKTNGVEVIRVAPNSNVGVGTNSPAARLHIFGAENTGSAAAFRITSGTIISGFQNMLMDGDEIDALSGVLFLNSNSSGNVSLANGGGNVGIGTSAPTARLDVRGGVSLANGGGNVGIGTSAPAARLDVRGDAQVNALGTGAIGILGRGDARAIVGVVGAGSCAGTYGVGGCAPINVGVLGATDTGVGVLGRSNTPGGSIFLGQSPGGSNRARIDSTGKGFFNGGTQTGGADFAESLRATDATATLEPGDVLVIDPQNPMAVMKSREASSRLVAGVYSTKPSVLAIGDHHIDDSLEGEVPVAIVGIVPTKVTAENGPIHVGDLLVTSSTPGHAMKARPAVVGGVEIYPTGAVLGKALEPLEENAGVIKVLVTLK